jgi:hypothetical protein
LSQSSPVPVRISITTPLFQSWLCRVTVQALADPHEITMTTNDAANSFAAIAVSPRVVNMPSLTCEPTVWFTPRDLNLI